MKTKEKIVQESLSLFNENTFELSTTNLIAKKSEVLEGSLWYHFNSKQDLVSVHTELFLDSFRKKRIYTEKNDPKELILGLLSIYGFFGIIGISFEIHLSSFQMKTQNFAKK